MFERRPQRKRLLPALFAAVVAGLTVLVTPWASAATPPDTVSTDKGTVKGTLTGTSRTFQGIPYAAPPVGNLRWRPPQPAASWTGVRDATQPGNECVQGSVLGSAPGGGSEDCLYLNVTTPAAARATSRLPVIVWIHGGAFAVGNGSDYDATRMANLGNVEVVTLNYRLGAFGFLAHPGLDTPESTSGNYGIQDQQAALRWVQRNIAAFGGDPGNVNVSGESAGAWSVCGQLISPAAKGLFARAIEQSGSCSTPQLTQQAAENIGTDVAANLGCTGADAVACLRSKDAATLAVAEPTQGQPIWAPVVGGTTLPLQPAQAISTGHWNKVPVLIGGTRDEMNLFVRAQEVQSGTPTTAESYAAAVHALYGANADAVLNQYPVTAFPSPTLALGAVQTDCGPGPQHLLSWCGELETGALLRAARTTGLYMYEFADRNAPPFVPGVFDGLGAYHGSELPYLFDIKNSSAVLSADQRALGDAMIRYWTRFAASGNPNQQGLPRWPEFGKPKDVLSLAPGDAGIRPVDAAAEHQIEFWRSLGLTQ